MDAKILALARSTDTQTLCAAWGIGSKAVASRLAGGSNLTFREVLQLSVTLGVRTSDLLSQHALQSAS